MKQKTTQKGFTIVEVTIVTAFVAMLLITITILITQITAIYQKGLTLKAIDGVGRNLVSEITTGINAAPSVDSVSLCKMLLSSDTAREDCLKDNANKFIYQSREDVEVDKVSGKSGRVQYYGVLCTGEYSYVWNTYYGKESGNTVSIEYHIAGESDTTTHKKDNFKLTRFQDTTYRACSTNVNTSNYKVPVDFNNINMTKQANGNRINMSESSFQEGFLDTSNVTLALYELTVFPISQDAVTLRSFFAGTFILATERGDVSITRSGDYCSLYDTEGEGADNIFDLGSNFNYCGINKFNFAARTAGSGV